MDQGFGFFDMLWLIVSTPPLGPIVCGAILLMVAGIAALNHLEG